MTSYEAKKHYQEQDVAGAYDEIRFRGLRGAFVNRLEQRLLVKALDGVRPGARVLDLPVGTGRMARRLSAEGYEVVGADMSLAMMNVAADLGRREQVESPLVRADGEALPFPDNSFDAVVCFRLLVHLPEAARQNVLREMARVASERVVAVYQPHRLAAWWLFYGLLLRRRLPRYFVAPRDIEREFADCGLRLLRSHSLLRGVFMERAYVLEPNR